jgi:dTDP-L-rhamnose 4-epimerase
LVTGGAGFIGSHLVKALLYKGHQVIVYDDFDPQVYAPQSVSKRIQDWNNLGAEVVQADIRDREKLCANLKRVDVILHQAAAVGVGQSMYQVEHYMDVNTRGTAVLLDILANEHHQVRKIVVASSMSIYGEGKYTCDTCGVVYPKQRTERQLAMQQWEILCPKCNTLATPVPTDEDKPLYPSSMYAISKRDQEEMCLVFGQVYQIPTVALRYFNVYGPGQALSNPYTGVAAIFASRLLARNPPIVFEDGLQSRDFVHVRDIVQANLLAMESDAADYEALNVGSGHAVTVLAIANTLVAALGLELSPHIANEYRSGDIRHCVSDITKIRKLLGYEPRVTFEEGMRDLIQWVPSQKPVDLFEQAYRELLDHGLILKQ